MEKLKVIADLTINFVNVIIWPLIVLLALCFFRKPIVSLLGRVKEIGYGDKKVIVNPQADTSNIESVQNIEDKKIFHEETDQYAENSIKTSIKFDELDDPRKISELLHISKFLFIIGRFEFIYGLIFGSQIKILEYLNSINSSTKNDLKKFFDTTYSRYPEVFSNYDYNSYLNFLINNGLIQELNSDTIQLTQFGQDFLIFLVQVKKDKQKIY